MTSTKGIAMTTCDICGGTDEVLESDECGERECIHCIHPDTHPALKAAAREYERGFAGN